LFHVCAVLWGRLAAPLEAQLPYKVDFLREIEIFRDLSNDDLTSLERSTKMTTVRKGRVIYRQGDTAEGLFLLKQGRVRLSWYGHYGKKLELAVLEPGTFFGDMPLLGERMRLADAEAIEDSTLCVMSQLDIERLVLAKPYVALRMLEVLGRRLAATEQRLEDMTYRGVPERLASVLLRLASDRGGVIEGVTHQDLGDMVGAYRETVTAVLDKLQAAGYIELGRRRIQIVNEPGLRSLLDG
jgi:CRP/FNR family transcriptional regulator